MADELPERLYKYRNFEDINHLRIILNEEFYFSSNEKLNDPFDLSINHYKFDIPSEDELAMYREYLEKQLIRSEEDRKKITPEFYAGPEENNIRLIDIVKGLLATCGVLSLSSSCKDIVMWAHYSDSHTGFCIGLNGQRLESFLSQQPKNNAQLISNRHVKYIKEMGQSINLFKLNENERDNFFKILFSTKYIRWEYEQEHRLLRSNGANTVYKFPTGIIDEVILGLNCTEDNISLIKNILKAKNQPHIKLYKMKQVEGGFELEKEEIGY